MRYTKEVSIYLEGDIAIAQTYISRARTFLGKVKNTASLGGLKTYALQGKLAEGVFVHAGITYGVPFIRIKAEKISTEELGCPYEGLAINQVLTTPVGDIDVEYTGGGCILVSPPSFMYNEGRPYSLLSGDGRNICMYGALGPNAWLYKDANGASWVIEGVSSTDTPSNTVTIEVWLKGRFTRAGVLGTSTKIGELVFRPSVLDSSTSTFNPVPATIGDVAAFEGPQPNPQGSSAFWNIVHSITGYAGSFIVAGATSSNQYVLGDVVKIDILGDGDISSDPLGAGITANVGIYKSIDVLNYDNTSTTADYDNYVCGSSGTLSYIYTVDKGAEWLYYYDSSGNIKNNSWTRYRSYKEDVYHTVDPITAQYSISEDSTYTANVGNYSVSTTYSTGVVSGTGCNFGPEDLPPNPSQVPGDVYYKETGVSVINMEHYLGDSGSDFRYVGWNGGIVNLSQAAPPSYGSPGSVTATAHPKSGEITVDEDENDICYVTAARTTP